MAPKPSFLGRFNRLGIKLTLSYTVVTIVPLLFVEVGALVLVLFVALLARVVPRAISTGMSLAAGQVQPFVASSPPDSAGLQAWFNNHVQLSGTSVDSAAVYVFDTRQRLLAWAPSDAATNPLPLFADLSSEVRAGTADPTQLYDISPTGLLTVLAPLRNNQGALVGYLVLKTPFLDAAQLYQQLATGIGQNLILVTVIAGAIATALGFISVSSLTRQLRAIARTAAAWGQGDFSRLNPEKGGDEIGQLARDLNQVARQLQALLQTQQNLAALEERNRLARDLHDTVKQQVFATTMQLAAADALIDQNPAAARQHLQEARGLANSARDELGVLISQLRPVALTGRTFADGLREYAADWSRQTHIALTARIEAGPALAPAAEQALLRVAQEALANVARHSSATSVQIDYGADGSQARLVVADDGQGFDPAAVKKGVGLDSMRERVSALGGALEVDTRPGGGARRAARLPAGDSKGPNP
jgi:NarL family two-component system sensor histidine kinase LiaS